MKCEFCGMEISSGSDNVFVVCSECNSISTKDKRDTGKIEAFFAWISIDDTGSEAFIGVTKKNRLMMLQNSDYTEALAMKNVAEQAANVCSPPHQIELIKFVRVKE